MRSKKIQLKQSEVREELGALLDKESKTTEERSKMQELKTSLSDLEGELQAALTLERQDDNKAKSIGKAKGEGDEVKVLREKASLSRIFSSIVNGHALTGEDSEYQASQKVRSNEIPLDMFERESMSQGLPPTTGLNIQSIVPSIFADSLAPSLNMEMPSAPSGTFSLPRITGNLAAEMKSKEQSASFAPASFDVVSTKPKRLSGRLSVTIEDLAEVGIPSFESALRMNLQQVISQVFDNQVLTGDGSGANLSGLFNQLTAGSVPTETLDFASVAEAMAGQVDGVFSMMLGDLRLIVRQEVYAKLASTFQVPVDATKGGGRSVYTAADWLGDKLAGFSAHSRLPAGASGVYKSLVVKNKIMPASCLPIWSNGITIQDMYTDAARGVEHITVHMLVGDVLLKHPEAYQEVQFKVTS